MRVFAFRVLPRALGIGSQGGKCVTERCGGAVRASVVAPPGKGKLQAQDAGGAALLVGSGMERGPALSLRRTSSTKSGHHSARSTEAVTSE